MILGMMGTGVVHVLLLATWSALLDVTKPLFSKLSNDIHMHVL
jgi:hypothetical protein